LIYTRKRKAKLNLHHDLLLEENKVRNGQRLAKSVYKLYRLGGRRKPQPLPYRPLESQPLLLSGSSALRCWEGVRRPACGRKVFNLSQELTGKTGS